VGRLAEPPPGASRASRTGTEKRGHRSARWRRTPSQALPEGAFADWRTSGLTPRGRRRRHGCRRSCTRSVRSSGLGNMQVDNEESGRAGCDADPVRRGRPGPPDAPWIRGGPRLPFHIGTGCAAARVMTGAPAGTVIGERGLLWVVRIARPGIGPRWEDVPTACGGQGGGAEVNTDSGHGEASLVGRSSQRCE